MKRRIFVILKQRVFLWTECVKTHKTHSGLNTAFCKLVKKMCLVLQFSVDYFEITQESFLEVPHLVGAKLISFKLLTLFSNSSPSVLIRKGIHDGCTDFPRSYFLSIANILDIP